MKNFTKNVMKNIIKNGIVNINDFIKTSLLFTILRSIVMQIYRKHFHFNSVLNLASLLLFFLAFVFPFEYIRLAKNIKIIS